MASPLIPVSPSGELPAFKLVKALTGNGGEKSVTKLDVEDHGLWVKNAPLTICTRQ